MRPAEEFSANPAGNVPDVSFQAYGVAPPLAVNACEYGIPISPFASDVIEIDSVEEGAAVEAEIVSVRLMLAVSGDELESVTANVSKVAFAAPVGVPLIKPVDELRFSPDGNVPELTFQEYGVVPPLAVSVSEYGDPTWALGNADVVILKH